MKKQNSFEFNLSEIEVVFENSNERNELITKINEEIIKMALKKLLLSTAHRLLL